MTRVACVAFVPYMTHYFVTASPQRPVKRLQRRPGPSRDPFLFLPRRLGDVLVVAELTMTPTCPAILYRVCPCISSRLRPLIIANKHRKMPKERLHGC